MDSARSLTISRQPAGRAVAREASEPLDDENGPYDEGYRLCPCFWGSTPGSLVARLVDHYVKDVRGLAVLDAGCGEGKNAFYLASRGATVLAVESSRAALRNAAASGATNGLTFLQADITTIDLASGPFDVVIAYGLLHCLPTAAEVIRTITRLQDWTAPGGYLILCTFNARRHDLSAHPGFSPTLLEHHEIVSTFAGDSSWEVCEVSDTDLFETHPHNKIPHHHSMTRMIARRAIARSA